MSDEAATNDSEDETLSGQSMGLLKRQTDKTPRTRFCLGILVGCINPMKTETGSKL